MTTIKSQAMAAGQLVALVAMLATASQARSLSYNDASVSAVIPSPNQEFGDELDIQRLGVASAPAVRSAAFKPMAALDSPEQAESSNESPVPVYVSPFNRAQRGATIATPVAPSRYEQRQESSHAPPNYAPSPAAPAPAAPSSSDDLKTSASYGKLPPMIDRDGNKYEPTNSLTFTARATFQATTTMAATTTIVAG